jgi:hypothetical protein
LIYYQKIISNNKNIQFIHKNSLFVKFKCNIVLNDNNFYAEDVDKIIDIMKSFEISIIFCYHYPENTILFKSL